RHAQRAIECGLRDEQLGAVRAIQAWVAHFRLDLQGGYTYALEALEILKPGSFWWTKTAASCFYSLIMLGGFEHAGDLIRTFVASEPDPDTRLAYLESGFPLATLLAMSGMSGARHGCNQFIDRLTQVAAGVDPKDRGYLMLAMAWRTFYREPDPYRALEEAQEAAALFLESGNRQGFAGSLYMVGMALTDMEVTSGEEALREARKVALANGNIRHATMSHVQLGVNLAGQADAAKRAEARRISDAYRDQPQLGPPLVGAVNRILAEVSMAAGDRETAEAATLAALASYVSWPHYRMQVVPTAVALFLEQGRIAEARQLAEQTLAQIDEQGGLGICDVPVRLAVAQTRFADGDLEGGGSALQSALEQLRLRADRIKDTGMRESYLARPHHRRLIDLAREHDLRPF
ncbi:MAG TPA: hypothetical protein VH165_28265, partial [Kofleriaceae bacterium]|nr:hypothetical protein [Kofleriaceae bacterium]